MCSLHLTTRCTRLSATGFASLVHLPRIRSLAVDIFDISSLKSLHILTHLESLTIQCKSLLDKKGAPHLPCADFPRLTSLTIVTEWQEPPNTFLRLTQLQTLRHLSLGTAAPSGFNYAALTMLTSLQMDNIDLENLEALQQLPQLMELEFWAILLMQTYLC